MKIPFNKPLITGDEQQYISDAIESSKISANGKYSIKCRKLLKNIFNSQKIFLTSNCTSALEMATLLLELNCDDEIIMPSFTHVGTANPFIRAGTKIVWCDIRKDTKNIDEKQIEALITEKTKALVAVHYAGIACQIDEIARICRRYNLILIEDCAMAIGSKFKNKPLGSFGDLAVVSFHETKNIHCGEGGALLVNNPVMLEPAEILINCGTNRSQFDQSKTDHYSWVAKSSNFQMSELQAAFLYAQLLELERVTAHRKHIWELYYSLLSGFLPANMLPIVPADCTHNAHLFYLMLKSELSRKEMIEYLNQAGIASVFHYIPLHSAPIWDGVIKSLSVTENAAATILRLPMYFGISETEVKFIVQKIREFFYEEL